MSEIEKNEKIVSGDGCFGEFEIKNKLGLHARAAVLLVQTASNYKSDITIAKDDIEVNGKSIMGILMLGATMGSIVKVMAKGSDAEKAVTELGRLISSKFGEE
jgi:phosphocarrier protein